MATNYDYQGVMKKAEYLLSVCSKIISKLEPKATADEKNAVSNFNDELMDTASKIRELLSGQMMEQYNKGQREAMINYHPGGNERYNTKFDPKNPHNNCGCDDCVRERNDQAKKTK